MAKIFHLIPKNTWDAIDRSSPYQPDSLSLEGFVHCCNADQILLIAEKFFKDVGAITLLRINANKLNSELKIEVPIEAPGSGVKFPHVYGPIPLEAIETTFNLKENADGHFELPNNLLK